MNVDRLQLAFDFMAPAPGVSRETLGRCGPESCDCDGCNSARADNYEIAARAKEQADGSLWDKWKQTEFGRAVAREAGLDDGRSVHNQCWNRAFKGKGKMVNLKVCVARGCAHVSRDGSCSFKSTDEKRIKRRAKSKSKGGDKK